MKNENDVKGETKGEKVSLLIKETVGEDKYSGWSWIGKNLDEFGLRDGRSISLCCIVLGYVFWELWSDSDAISPALILSGVFLLGFMIVFSPLLLSATEGENAKRSACSIQCWE